MALSGVQFKIHHKIILKIEKAGGTSQDKAVTIEEAGLNIQEQLWLDYFTGASIDIIRKIGDTRYYITH